MKKSISDLAIVGFFLLFGCAGQQLQVEKIASTANPTEQVALLEQELNQARGQNVQTLSPKWFVKAEASLETAKKVHQDKGALSDIFSNVELGRAELKQACTFADVAKSTLKDALSQREETLKSGVAERPKDFEKAEQNFKKVTEAIEDNDLRWAENHEQNVVNEYRDLQAKSLQDRYLASARTAIEEAKKNKADKYAPKTLKSAEEAVIGVEEFISANPRLISEIELKARQATATANHLKEFNQQSQRFAMEHPEEAASQIEDRVTGLSSELRAGKHTIAQLEREKMFNEKFEQVSQMFGPDEAEVYREGENLIIRLRNIKFPFGQAVIQTNAYPLLAKVQRAVEVFQQPKIIIEGHTDATGSEKANQMLSIKRAEAVKRYLLANSHVPADKITVEGYGFERPLTDNKSPKSRAMNRRIDIVIEAVPPSAAAE